MTTAVLSCSVRSASSWRIFSVKKLREDTKYFHSIVDFTNCQLPKYIFGWDRVDIFHLWRRPKIEHARARANKHIQQRCMQTTTTTTTKSCQDGFFTMCVCVCVGDITTYILFLVLSISAYSHATDSITNSISFWYYIFIHIYVCIYFCCIYFNNLFLVLSITAYSHATASPTLFLFDIIFICIYIYIYIYVCVCVCIYFC